MSKLIALAKYDKFLTACICVAVLGIAMMFVNLGLLIAS